MERIAISVSDEFAAELAAFLGSERYENRSEAVRDLARLGLKRARIDRSISGDASRRSLASSTAIPATHAYGGASHGHAHAHPKVWS